MDDLFRYFLPVRANRSCTVRTGIVPYDQFKGEVCLAALRWDGLFVDVTFLIVGEHQDAGL